MTVSPAEPATTTTNGPPTNVSEPRSTDDDTPPASTDQQGNPATPEPALGDAGQQAIDRMKVERNEANKQLKAAQRQLEEMRKASMTETERAVSEAEAKGRTAAATEFGKRLATSEIRSTAAEAGADLAGVFDYLDLARFVGEDGEPDDKAIKGFVDGLPKKNPGTPGFDGGARTSAAPPANMNDIIRAQAKGGRRP